MKIFNYHVWNRLVPLDDEELQVRAVRGDDVFSSNGFLFLIQRTNGWNNINCFKLSQCKFRICQRCTNISLEGVPPASLIILVNKLVTGAAGYFLSST